MRFLIITGMSGAGKTQVIHSLEDMGYYCIDNMPVSFLVPFANMCKNESEKFKNVAVVVDIRGGATLLEIGTALDTFKKDNFDYEILFLEANDSVILNRYKETRRKHPLAPSGSIEEGIYLERDRLSFLRGSATRIIDTSQLKSRDLKELIWNLYSDTTSGDRLKIHFQSFGFKNGIPRDADMVFDVRFLPNPFYINELRPLTGLEKKVADFVLSYSQSIEFIDKLEQMLTMLIPHYIQEGKTSLVIAIGCTGGKHRSVAIAEKICNSIKQKYTSCVITHRDITKE